MGKIIIIAEQPAIFMAQRDDDRPRQRGQIDHIFRLKPLLRPGHSIAENKATFGIGVDHFDRLARHGRHHISRTLRAAIGHIFNKATYANNMSLCLAPCEREHGSGNSACAAHIPLHIFHTAGRFQGNPSSIKSDALTDEHDGLLLSAICPIPAHDQQLWFADRPLGNAQQRAHSCGPHFCLTQNFNLDTGFGQALAALDKGFGINDVGRLCNQLTGQSHTFDNRGLARPCRIDAFWRTDDNQFLQGHLLFFRQFGAVRIIAPPPQNCAAGKTRNRPSIWFGIHLTHIERNTRFARCQQPSGKRAARLFQIFFAACSNAEQQNPLRPVCMRDMIFKEASRLALKARGFCGGMHGRVIGQYRHRAECALRNEIGKGMSPVWHRCGKANLDHNAS